MHWSVLCLGDTDIEGKSLTSRGASVTVSGRIAGQHHVMTNPVIFTAEHNRLLPPLS